MKGYVSKVNASTNDQAKMIQEDVLCPKVIAPELECEMPLDVSKSKSIAGNKVGKSTV